MYIAQTKLIAEYMSANFFSSHFYYISFWSLPFNLYPIFLMNLFFTKMKQAIVFYDFCFNYFFASIFFKLVVSFIKWRESNNISPGIFVACDKKSPLSLLHPKLHPNPKHQYINIIYWTFYCAFLILSWDYYTLQNNLALEICRFCLQYKIRFFTFAIGTFFLLIRGVDCISSYSKDLFLPSLVLLIYTYLLLILIFALCL